MKSSITGRRCARRLKLRAALEQRLRIGVLRILEHRLCRTLLANLAIAHHDHVVGDFADHGQIVGDEQHRHLVLLLQVADEVEDLLLDGHVERRRRLVGDQELGLAGDRHRDHHPLLLAARHLERILVYALFGFRNADLAEQRNAARPRLAGRQAHVQAQHFAQLKADAEDRIERTHRLLENHRDFLAAQVAQFALRQIEQIAPAVNHFAAGKDAGILLRQEPQNRQRRHRLAAAGFADQGHGAVDGDIEADVLDRFEGRVPVNAKVDLQVADGYQRFAHGLVSLESRIISAWDPGHRAARR